MEKEYIIDNTTGELVEKENENEIALRETHEVIDYQKVYDLYEKAEEIKSQIDLMLQKAKPQLMEYIKAHDNKPIKYHDLTISYRKGYMKNTFDSKKFKKDHEDLFNQYTYLTGIDETISVRFGGNNG